MTDPSPKEYLEEISALKQRIRDLEKSNSEYRRLDEEIRLYSERLSVFNELGLSLTSELNLELLLDSIAQRALKLIGGASCNCYLYNPQTDLLERVVSAGTPLIPSKKTRQRGEGMVGQVWVRGTALLVNDYRSWSGRTRAYDSLPSRALVAAPFHCGTEFLGVLNIMAPLPHQYTQVDVEMLNLFATQAAIAIRNARLFDQMKLELAERKRAEGALRDSEERHRRIVEALSDAVLLRAEGRVIYANPAALKLFRTDDLDDLIGKRYMDLVHPDDRAISFERIRRNIDENSVAPPREHRVLARDGHVVHVESTGVPIKYQGETQVFGVFRDITELKQAEEIRRRSREATERLAKELAILADIGRLTGSTLAIGEVYERVATEIGKLLPFDSLIISLYDSRQQMLEVTYVSGLDLPGRRVGDSFPLKGTIMEAAIRTRRGVIVGSESPQGLVDQFPSLLVSARAGMRSVMLVPLISRDEVIGNLLMRCQRSGAYTEQDLLMAEKIGMQISGAIANAQMFNELSETEKALREQLHLSQQLLDAIPIPIFYKNDQGMYLGCNAAFQEFVGLTQEQVVGKTVREVFPPDLAEVYDQADRELFRQSGKQVYETSFLHADGSRHDIIFNKAIYVGIDGHDAGLVGAILDITELRHADRERHRLEERLRRSEKMEALGQLAGGVAHDLNNVLGILSGYSELLLDEIPEGSRSRDHVEKILQSTERGAAIIQDLLTLARRGVIVSEVIDLNGIVSGFLKSPVFEKMKDFNPRVTFRTELDPDLLNIKGSPVHLEKTLMNLVSNAAESISGGGDVTIRTEGRYLDRPVGGYDEIQAGDYAVLTVSDTGIGISAENKEKIFEPFYTKKTMGRSGTGLGLAIVWGTVKDHNGYIDVQTEIGKGTTFTLYFPVTREEMVAKQQKVPMERYMGKGESVLVVDDIAEQRDVASRLLTRLGYEVHAVSGGEEAVEYLKGNKVDILVLDMIMAPGIDGLETYRRVLETHPRQKAILVSGFSQTERVREAQKLGAGVYVKKPYAMEMIGAAIRDELGRPRAA